MDANALLNIAHLMHPNVQQAVIANVQAQNEHMAANAAKADAETAGKMSRIIKENPDGTVDVSIKNAPKDGKFESEKAAGGIEQQTDAAATAIEQAKGTSARLLGLLNQHESQLLDKADPGRAVQDLSSFRGRFRASRELGANPIGAAIDAIRVGTPLYSKEAAAEKLSSARLGQAASFNEKALQPELRQQRADQRLDLQQDKFDRTVFNDAVREITPDMSPEQALQVVGSRVGEMKPGFKEAAIAQLTREQAKVQAVKDGNVGKFIATLGAKDVEGYDPKSDPDAFDRFIKDAQDTGTFAQFRPGQIARAKAKFNGLWKEIDQNNELKQESMQLKIANAKRADQRIQIEIDKYDLDPQQVEYYSQKRQSGGGEPPKQYQVAVDSYDQKHGITPVIPLSPKASDAITQIDSQRALVSQLHDELKRLKTSPEWRQYANVPLATLPTRILYRLGVDPKNPVGDMQSKLSIARWAGTAALIRGIRRGDIIREASQHMPQDGDTLANIDTKIMNADDYYATQEERIHRYGAKSGVPIPESTAKSRVTPSLRDQDTLNSRKPAAGKPGSRVITDPNEILKLF